MRKLIGSCLIAAYILGLTVGTPASAEPVALLPAAVVDHGLVANYRRVQEDPLQRQEAKIVSAVLHYFEAKSHSLTQRSPTDLSFVIDCSSKMGSEFCDYELGRLRYTLLCWAFTGLQCVGCQLEPIVDAMDIDDEKAAVHLSLSGRVQFAHDPEPFVFEHEAHTILLVRSPDGFWRLVDDRYQDEFSECYPRGTDFAELSLSLPHRIAAWEASQATQPVGAEQDTGTLGYVYLSYDRNRARSYATTYTDNVDYSTEHYNDYFHEWCTSDRADCCNFVCQCVWYGFGGINNRTYIENHSRPMVELARDGGTDWWCDDTYPYTCSPDWHYPWINVGDFRTLFKTNYQYNLVGVQGWDIGLSGLSVGDLAIGTNLNGSLHIMIVTSATDLDGDGVLEYSEVKVSAHTKNWTCPASVDTQGLVV